MFARYPVSPVSATADATASRPRARRANARESGLKVDWRRNEAEVEAASPKEKEDGEEEGREEEGARQRRRRRIKDRQGGRVQS